MDIPVRCTRCGAQGTTSNLIGGDNVRNLTLRNVTMMGGCPRCGGDMKAIDGTYDFVGGALTAFRRLDAGRAGELQALLRDSRAGRLNPDQATERAAALDPNVAALIEAMRNQPQWTSSVIVMVLLAVLAIIVPLLSRGDGLTDADHEALRHDIRQAIEQAAPTPIYPTPPGTTVAVPSRTQTERASPPRGRKRPPKTHGQRKKRKR